jgi:aminomethyltransferase
MPVQYSSIVEEHTAVRERVGLFDISHMGRLVFEGPGALNWLDRTTTNKVANLVPNQIQYNLMANETGGLIDDILVYRRDHGGYDVVCNASNRTPVIAQFYAQKQNAVASLTDRTLETAMIAVQGPRALATLQPLYDGPLDAIKYYHLTTGKLLGNLDTVVSRTGYTGEDGFEVVVPANQAVRVWEALMKSGQPHGILPCGLGARDTLRFEAGMPLYGHELLDTINPYAAGVGWAVKLAKGAFVGDRALKGFKVNPGLTRVGLRAEGKRIARQGAAVLQGGREIGTVTSGTFSPTLQASLAMALIEPKAAEIGTALELDIRGHREPVRVVELPFYKRAAH